MTRSDELLARIKWATQIRGRSVGTFLHKPRMIPVSGSGSRDTVVRIPRAPRRGAREVPKSRVREEVTDIGTPTYEDANIVVRLAQWWSVGKVDEAANFAWSDRFVPTYGAFVKKFPPGSEEYRKLVNLCAWYETVGTLHKHGLINRDLLFDWLAVAPIWNRRKGFALGMRKDRGVAELWENFEAMAKAQEM